MFRGEERFEGLIESGFVAFEECIVDDEVEGEDDDDDEWDYKGFVVVDNGEGDGAVGEEHLLDDGVQWPQAQKSNYREGVEVGVEAADLGLDVGFQRVDDEGEGEYE